TTSSSRRCCTKWQTSDLDLTAIVNPVRKMLRRVNFFEGEIESIDLSQKQVVVSHGLAHHQHSRRYDHLVIGLGSITNLYELPGLPKDIVQLSHESSAQYLSYSGEGETRVNGSREFGRCQQSLFLLFYLSISDNSYGRDLGIQLSPQGFDFR